MQIEAGKTYVTRDGRKVRVVATDAKSDGYPVIGLMADEDGQETPEQFMADGKWIAGPAEHDADLVREHREPRRFKVWLNLKTGSVLHSPQPDGGTGFGTTDMELVEVQEIFPGGQA